MAVAPDLDMIREQERLFNFLKKYSLQQYYHKFLMKGVHRLNHLKDVCGDDASLDEIGLSRIERQRLRKKVKENVEWMGKLMKRLTGKNRQFDVSVPDVLPKPLEDAGGGQGGGGGGGGGGGMRDGGRATIIPKEEVKLSRVLGEGAHGTVHEGTWADEHGAVAVAIKTLYGKQEVQSLFIKEANSMATLHHKHIIQLYGIVLSQPLMLVEELAPFGSLHSYIHKEGRHLTLQLFHAYACQIADAMTYLEKRRIVHRDLAIRNILLAHIDFVKLSDFGMARVLDDNSEVYNLSNLTTRIPVAWSSPEAMSNAKFSSASDVWSYGVTLWEIYSLGKTPWKGVGPLEIRDKVIDGERLEKPKRCPEEVFDVMLACWKKEAQERPTFVDILKRVKQLVPKQVRAIKAHTLRDDPSSLSFKTGDLIYVIDRPSADWISGMKTDGSVGHFKAEFVDDVLAPLDDLRATVEAGKPVSRLSISSPTDVDHMVHVNADGTKWISDNARTMDFTPPHSPIRTIPPEEQALPFKVVDNRSQNPQGMKSPNRRVSTGASSEKSLVKANPYTYPDPVGWENPNEHSKYSQELPTPDADNQYVSMTRAGMLSPTQKVVPSQQVGKGGAEGAENGKDKSQGDGDTYITMTSFSVRKQEKMNRQQSYTLPRSGSSAAKLKKEDADSAELDLNPFGNNPPGRSHSVSTAPVHQRVNGQQPLPVDENSDSDVFLPVSAAGGLVKGDSPPSSHYDIPRPALSASHYDRPRSAVAAISEGATNDYQPSPSASLARNDSLLDTPNYSADTGPLLPEPLTPESSPSPTKASSRRHSDTPMPISSNSKKKNKHSEFVELKFLDDKLLFEGRSQAKTETDEAVVPRSTRYLYSTSSVGQNSSATVAAAAAASGRPIPKPRAGTMAAVSTSLGNENVMDMLGQAFGSSPPVPTRRRKLLSEGPALPGIAAEDDKEMASASAITVPSGSSHYQPLLHPGSNDSSSVGNFYQPLSIHTRSPKPPSNHQISSSSNSTSSSTQANSTYQPLSPTTLDRVGDEYVKIDPTTRQVQPMGSRGGAKTEDQSSEKPAIGPRERSSTEKPSQNSPTVRDRSRTENRPAQNGTSPSSGSKLRLRVQQDKEEVLESILVEEEFSGCEVDMCRFALEQHNYDTEKAKEEIRVQILLGMLLPNIREQDCRRALQHCQHKTNRAAVWLLQQSEDIERKAQ